MKTVGRTQEKNIVEPEAPLSALGFLSSLGLLCFGALCFLLLIAPFYLSGFPAAAVTIENGAAYVPPMTFLTLTVIGCLLFALSGESAPRSRLTFIVGAFSLWCALSLFGAVYLHEAFLEIARVASCLAWFFLARILLQSDDENQAAKRRFYFLVAIVGGAVWVCLIALKGFLQDREFRQFSTFFNPNLLANYCAMALPLSLSLLFSQRGKWVVFLSGVATLIIFGGLASTRSKGGFLALGVALLVFVFAALKARGPFIKEALRARRQSAIVVSLVVLILCGAMVQKTVVPRLMQANSGEDNSTQFRAYTWRGTVDMVKARPVFGFGPGSYSSAYPQFAITGFTLTAHQVWLQLAAESGVPATLLLLTACGFAAAKCWRALSAENWYIAAGSIATIAAFSIHGLTDAGWSLISIALLLCVALALIDSLHHSPLTTHHPSLNYYWLVLSLVFGLFAAGYSRVVQAEDLVAQSRESLEKRLVQDAVQQAIIATEINPYSARVWHNRARIKQALGQNALAEFLRVTRLQPTKSTHYLALAEEMQRHNQEQSDILENYSRAVELEPNDPAPRLARAKYLLSLNDEQSKQRAFQDYESVTALYDAPYGKYPAIAEMANFDLGEAIVKVADHALRQNDKAKAETMLQKAQAILGVWQANAERNRTIASQSETMNNFEAQEKKARDLEDEIESLKERLK